jgi:16S rRNA (cytosine967-C5)-methyltransferase
MLSRLRPHWRSDAALPARIDSLLGGDRRLGSRDRRLYRELIYTVLRYLPWMEPLLDSAPGDAVARAAWLAADAPSAAGLQGGRGGRPSALPPRGPREGQDPGTRRRGAHPGLVPGGVPRGVGPAAPRRPSIKGAALDPPADKRRGFRLPGIRAARVGLAQEPAPGGRGERCPWTRRRRRPTRIALGRSRSRTSARSWSWNRSGSRLGGHWLDACAGAGGKTLQLASLLGAAGTGDRQGRAERAAGGAFGKGGPGRPGGRIDPDRGPNPPAVMTGSWSMRRAPARAPGGARPT